MRKKYFGWLLSALTLAAFTSCGEKEINAKVVLNEVLSVNQTNFQDDYGLQHAWIEVFNKTYGSVDIAGYRISVSNQPGDTTTYVVPKGDVQTLIKPRQHTLFWADGQPNRGTFHMSCTLDSAATSWIGLYDGGGALIDQVVIPALAPDQSYARINDAHDEWEVKGGNDPAKYVTPSTNNLTINKNEKQEKFAQHDQIGVGMAITAMSVVFSGLLLLYIAFKSLGIGLQNFGKTNKGRKEPNKEMENKTSEATTGNQDEVYAAIAMALHEELGGVHDVETNVLTIVRKNSPWNSKHLLLRK